jgi:hypothetical protein
VDPRVQSWPVELPVLHPDHAREVIGRIPLRSIKSVIRSHEGFTGDDIVVRVWLVNGWVGF